MIFPFEITKFQVCCYTFTVRIKSTLFFTFHILLFILSPLSYNSLQIEYTIFPYRQDNLGKILLIRICAMLKNAWWSLLNCIFYGRRELGFFVVYIHYLLNRRNGAPVCEIVEVVQDYPDAMGTNHKNGNSFYNIKTHIDSGINRTGGGKLKNNKWI